MNSLFKNESSLCSGMQPTEGTCSSVEPVAAAPLCIQFLAGCIPLSAFSGSVQPAGGACSSAQPVGLGRAAQRGAGFWTYVLPAAALQLCPAVLTSSAISKESDRSHPVALLEQPPLMDDKGAAVSVLTLWHGLCMHTAQANLPGQHPSRD